MARCECLTKEGKRCKREANAPSHFCKQHKGCSSQVRRVMPSGRVSKVHGSRVGRASPSRLPVEKLHELLRMRGLKVEGVRALDEHTLRVARNPSVASRKGLKGRVSSKKTAVKKSVRKSVKKVGRPTKKVSMKKSVRKSTKKVGRPSKKVSKK